MLVFSQDMQLERCLGFLVGVFAVMQDIVVAGTVSGKICFQQIGIPVKNCCNYP